MVASGGYLIGFDIGGTRLKSGVLWGHSPPLIDADRLTVGPVEFTIRIGSPGDD